jgi:NitT/TauT family transport system substrate-binding protein
VVKFVRASIRGWQEYLRNPGPTNAHLLTLNPALNPAQEAYTAQALREGAFVTGEDPNGAEVGRMTSDRWHSSFDQLKSLGIVHTDLDPTTTYALKFVQ